MRLANISGIVIGNAPLNWAKGILRGRRRRRRQTKRPWKSEFASFQSSSRLLPVSNFVRCRRTSESWIPKNAIQIQKERGNFVVACVLPLYNVKLSIFTSWSCSDGKEMYKKTWCTWKMVVLVVKPVVFVTFSLWSPSSDLEVPNRDLTTATATATRRSNTIRFISKITTLQDVKL